MSALGQCFAPDQFHRLASLFDYQRAAESPRSGTALAERRPSASSRPGPPPPLSQKARLCPLWVKSRHVQCTTPCPLCPRKRTCAAQYPMSALGQKRTLTATENIHCFFHGSPEHNFELRQVGIKRKD